MKKLSKIQLLSAAVPPICGIIILFVYLASLQNSAANPYFFSSLTFLGISTVLLISPFFILQSQLARKEDHHVHSHHLLEPIILGMLLVGFSLLLILESILTGVEGGGIFFLLRFSVIVTLALLNLTAASNLAISSYQSARTSVILQGLALLINFLLIAHFTLTFQSNGALSVILVYVFLNVFPQAFLYYFTLQVCQKLNSLSASSNNT